MAVLWMGGGLCCTCAVAAFTYLRSPRRPVVVNCHFCNTDHQVTVVGNLIEFVISNHFHFKGGGGGFGLHRTQFLKLIILNINKQKQTKNLKN